MNIYEKVIQESLENIQAEPGVALKLRVMRSANNELIDLSVYRRRIPVRAAILAAVIGALVLTTAFTFGNEIVGVIKQIVFGDSIATQVEKGTESTIGSWGVMDTEDLCDAKDYPLGLFDTLEEARQAAPFAISEPSYLPDNVTGLRNVGVWRAETEDIPWTHFVILSYDIALEGGGIAILQLRQTYAGPNAYFVIENVSPIEKVMVGSSEAVLITAEGRDWVDTDDMGYTLYWLYDGIAYELSAEYHDGYTPETMIRIAESIR